jgi:hypothetical protein
MLFVNVRFVTTIKISSFPQKIYLAWFLKLTTRRHIFKFKKTYRMKKTVITMLLALMCTGITMAQKSTTKKLIIEKVLPPDVVLNSFKEKYTGEAVPVWSKTNSTNFMAHIDSSSSGNKQYIEFSPEGKWLSTATVLLFEQLSEEAQKKLKEQYPDMQVDVVKKIEREGIAVFYKVKLVKDKESKTLFINDAGFISE